MTELTAEDYWEAAQNCLYRVFEMRRTLELMGEYCPPDHRLDLERRIDAELKREARFQQAAIAARSAEVRP